MRNRHCKEQNLPVATYTSQGVLSGRVDIKKKHTYILLRQPLMDFGSELCLCIFSPLGQKNGLGSQFAIDKSEKRRVFPKRI